MHAFGQFSWRVSLMFIDNDLVGISRNLGADSFAHEKTGYQPIEQRMFAAVTQMNVQVHGTDLLAHGAPRFCKANAPT
jgi:hypothetical protein